ncbi:uncharacterized protein LOC118179682 [Stegodyphus dumicola]|uniref:uncharacterized protein LOC118179682 n=1 Tax=Stegodyphus dumicola TaxID=202533 RepID=UPI0015AB70FB|nr:uncharacterized protein LOC118179682 [Stegodyphus dumicola]
MMHQSPVAAGMVLPEFLKLTFPPRTYHVLMRMLFMDQAKVVTTKLYIRCQEIRFEQPDFHRLDYFGYLSFSVIFDVGHSLTLSDVWREAVENHEKGLSCKASDTK